MIIAKQKTKIGRANARGDTLRTGVPKMMAEILDVTVGDSLEWNLNHIKGEIVITITKSED